MSSSSTPKVSDHTAREEGTCLLYYHFIRRGRRSLSLDLRIRSGARPQRALSFVLPSGECEAEKKKMRGGTVWNRHVDTLEGTIERERENGGPPVDMSTAHGIFFLFVMTHGNMLTRQHV